MAGGKPAYHEIMPDDFGQDVRRWDLLRDCLRSLLTAFPEVQLTLLGTKEALSAFGLRPNVSELIGSSTVNVVLGSSDRPGAIRILFCSSRLGHAAPKTAAGLQLSRN